MTPSAEKMPTGFAWVTPTVEFDPSLAFVELRGYRFHVRTFGDETRPPLIVVVGGPGGDSKYLAPLQALSKGNYVILYDQRGTGLSPRVKKDTLTLESSLDDLHAIVGHYGARGPVKLIGHSWGTMLVVGYLGRHPERLSHAVVVEPGILNSRAAKEFVQRFKAQVSSLRYIAVCASRTITNAPKPCFAWTRPLLWVSKSMDELAAALTAKGLTLPFDASHPAQPNRNLRRFVQAGACHLGCYSRVTVRQSEELLVGLSQPLHPGPCRTLRDKASSDNSSTSPVFIGAA
jgi:pimeloyl-ACP methyl ester carboxylesterase